MNWRCKMRKIDLGRKNKMKKGGEIPRRPLGEGKEEEREEGQWLERENASTRRT